MSIAAPPTIRLIAAAALWLMAGSLMPCAAADAPQSTPRANQAQTLSTADLKSLVGTLENDAARQKFVSQLKSLIAAREQVAGAHPKVDEGLGVQLLARLSDGVDRASAAITNAFGVLLDLPHFADWVKRQVSNEAHRATWLELLLKLAVVLALATFAQWLAARLLRRPRAALEHRAFGTLPAWLARLAGCIVLDLAPIAVFATVAYGTLPFTKPQELTRLVTLVIVNANVIVRATLAIARHLLAPRVWSSLAITMSEETASYWYVWLRRLVSFSVFGFFSAQAAHLIGLPDAGYNAVTKAIGLVVAALVVILILQNRHDVADWIRGKSDDEEHDGTLHVLRARLGDMWHVLALLYVVAIYLVWAFGIAGGFDFILRASVLSVVILLGARFLVGGAEEGLRRFFAIGDDLKRRFPMLEERAGRYIPVLATTVRVVLYTVAAFALLQTWGLGGLDWIFSDFGRHLIRSLATIAITIAVSLAVWEGTSILMEMYVAKQAAANRAARHRTRALTLFPLLKKVLSIVLAVVAALIVLSSIGIDIAPLLAGAGVVGIAVGFGAQSLVKDLITGLFIVLEDTLAVGDVVALGNASGLVESITARSIRLRDLSGSVHTIPFSEVNRVVNMTKDFSYAVFDIGVAYREDVDEVIEVVKALGAELQADPKFGPLILEPLEVLGLDRFADSAVILRARFKTRPIEQWNVTREFNRRLKRRFDELGIEIPFPHQTVYFGIDKAGQAPPMRLAVDAEAYKVLRETSDEPSGRAGERVRPIEGGLRGGAGKAVE